MSSTRTADADLVQVEAEGVSGWCRWPDAPTVGQAVDVELDVPGEVRWDDIEVGGAELTAGRARSGLVVRAEVLDLDEQDVLTLRLAEGGILLVDTVGEAPLQVVGRTVTLRLDDVLVHPTNP